MIRQWGNVHVYAHWPNFDSSTQSGLWSVGNWVHTIVVIDFTTQATEDIVKLYINGQNVGTTHTTYSGYQNGFKTGTGTCHFAGDSAVNAFDAGFSGYLDDFRIYDKAFTPDEVDELYGIYLE